MWRSLSLAAALACSAAHGFDEKAALKESQAAIGRALGEHRFTDSEGRPVRLADLRGKPLVVNFVYTGCFQACPVATAFLASAAARLSERHIEHRAEEHRAELHERGV